MIVGGGDTTVGVTGYTLGGGHSPLSPKLGLGVDQLVEIEMVLSDLSVVVLNSVRTVRVYPNSEVSQ